MALPPQKRGVLKPQQKELPVWQQQKGALRDAAAEWHEGETTGRVNPPGTAPLQGLGGDGDAASAAILPPAGEGAIPWPAGATRVRQPTCPIPAAGYGHAAAIAAIRPAAGAQKRCSGG